MNAKLINMTRLDSKPNVHKNGVTRTSEAWNRPRGLQPTHFVKNTVMLETTLQTSSLLPLEKSYCC